MIINYISPDYSELDYLVGLKCEILREVDGGFVVIRLCEFDRWFCLPKEWLLPSA